MSTSSAPLASAPPSIHPLLSPRRPLPLLLRFQWRTKAPKFAIRSVADDRVAVGERKEAESYGLNGNGSGSGIGLEVREREGNGSVEVLVNGNGASNGNGSLMKYGGGNGKAGGDGGSEERTRKKRVEEIGKEDAWFRSNESQQPQV